MRRVLLSYFASKYVQLVTGIPYHDTTAGFVCWNRKVLETIQLDKIKFVGYAFQIEMKFKAWKHGFNIQEVSVIFTDRTEGESKMSKTIITEAIFGIIRMRELPDCRKEQRFKKPILISYEGSIDKECYGDQRGVSRKERRSC